MTDFEEDIYCREMGVIRKRYYRIYYRARQWWGKTVTISVSEAEELALHFRLLIEGVVLAGAHSVAKEHPDIFEKIKDEWNLTNIIKILERGDVLCLPSPVSIFYENNSVKFNIIKNDSIEKSEWTRIHGIMSNILHRRHMLYNFGDLENILNEIIIFLPRIRSCLRKHAIYVKTKNGMKLIVCEMHFHKAKSVFCRTYRMTRSDKIEETNLL